MQVRPALRGSVIGIGLGRFVFAGRGVGLRAVAMLAPALLLTAGAIAGPEGAKVVAGEASIKQHGNRTVIRAGDRTIIDYTRFDIGAGEKVRFIQPGADARVLNRINSAEPTRIDGSLRANGIVYFVNPSGVMFGATSVINTNGLYAAGAHLSDQDFLAGVNKFTNVTGEVVNNGSITSPQAALVGTHVINTGVIDTGGAAGGVVALVAGDEVVLSKNGETMSVRVSPDNAGLRDPGKAGVEHTGSIRARNGRARIIAGDMYSLAIKDAGHISAGDVKIQGKGTGRVVVSGSIDAVNQGPSGTNGGRVEITGQHVAIAGAHIDASGSSHGGEVYIGGGEGGKGDIRTAQTALVDGTSVVRADSVFEGSGGRVVVWSDTHSAVYGTISATGGMRKGDGGFIETSGKQTLDLRGASVDASASNGKAGTWLLDPYNLTITSAGGGVDDISGNSYTPTGDDAQVSADSISTALSTGGSGTNVLITTGLSGSAGTQAGNLTVNAPITKNSNTTATLTLNAAGDLIVNQAISSTGGGSLNVDLLAESGNVTIAAPITTTGGSFSSTGANFTNNATITTAGGDVTLSHTGLVSVNQAISAAGAGGGGLVTLRGSDIDINTTTGSVDAGSGGLTIRPALGVTDLRIAGANAASTLALSAAELERLSVTSGGLIRFGSSGDTYTLTIGAADLSGVSGQSGANYRFSGGATSFTGELALHNNAGATFNVTSIAGDAGAANLTFLGGGTLTLTTTGNATIGTNAATLAASTIGGNLDIGFRTSVTQSGALNVTGTTHVRSVHTPGASITLTNALNTFNGALSAHTYEADGTTIANANVTITSAGPLSLGASQVGGEYRVNTTSGDLTVAGAVSAGSHMALSAFNTVNVNAAASAGGQLKLTSSDVAINTSTGSLSGGAQGVVIEPSSGSSVIAINDALAGGLSLSTAELLRISTTGDLIIGTAGHTGAMSIGSLGAVDLSSTNYNMVLRAGTITFAGTGAAGGMTLADDKRMALISTGAIVGRGLSVPDVTIGGSSASRGVMAIAAGNIALSTSAGVISGSSTTGDIVWRDSASGGTTVFQHSVTDSVNSFTASTDGLAVSASNDVAVETTGSLTLTNAIIALGGFVDLSSGGSIIVPSSGTASRIAANRLRAVASGGSIGGAGGGTTLYTTIGTDSVTGLLEASAASGIDISNGLGQPAINLDEVVLTSGTGLAKLVNTGTIVQKAGSLWTGNGFDVRSSGHFIWLKEGLTSSGNVRFETPSIFIVSPGKTVDAGTNALTIVAKDLGLDGSLTAAATTISGSASAPQTIGLGTATGDMTIDNAELSRITTDTLAINGSTVTRITVSGVNLTGGSAPDRVILGAGDATGRVLFNSAASSFNALNVLANNGVDVDVNLTAGVDELFINGDFDNAAAPSSASDRINLASGVTLTSAGLLTLRSTTGGTAAAGNVTLNSDAGVTIAGNFSNTAGSTTIDADRNDDGAGTFTLTTGSTMTLGDSVNGRSLQIVAGDIDLQGSISDVAGAITIGRSTSGEIWFGDLTGAPTGALKLDTGELCRITASSIAFGGTNTTLLHVAGLRNNSLGGADSSRMNVTGSISLTGDDMTIVGTGLAAEQADLVVTRGTAGSIGLGTATGGMTIDNSELALVTAKTLKVSTINSTTPSDNTTRSITATDIGTAQTAGIAGKVTLEAGNALTLTNTTPSDLTRFRFAAFEGKANNGITAGTSITTTAGDLVLNADADSTAQGNERLTLLPDSTLASAGNLTLDATTANAAGGLTLTAAGNVSILADMSTNGTTVVRADSDSSGSGALILGNTDTLNATDSTLTITAADVQIGTTSTSASALSGRTVTIDRSTVGSINIGAFTEANSTGTADPMILTNAELARVFATNLEIGGGNANQVRVNGATVRNPGTTTINALGSTGTISFETAASTFKGLAAKSDAGITITQAISATTGGIELDAAANTSTVGDGTITLGANLAGAATGTVDLESNVVLTSATTTIAGKNVTFRGKIDGDGAGSRTLDVNSSNSGVTKFLGDVGTTNRLAVLRTNDDGENVISGDILAQQRINLGGDSRMDGSAQRLETSGGEGIRFGGDARIRGTILAVGSTGEVRVVGKAIVTDELTLTASGGGDVIFRSTLALNDNATISAQGGAGSIDIRDNIFSNNGNHNLTLSVNPVLDNPPTPTQSAPSPLPPRIPLVKLGGAVGKHNDGTAGALGNLTINSAGRTVVPRQATIVGDSTADGFDVSLTGDFVIGQSEKITSLGALSISARKITVGDLTAKNNITLTASSNDVDAINILNRPVQQLLAVQFNPDGRASDNKLTLLDADDGLDIVSAFGTITFSDKPQVVGTGPGPRLATATGELGGVQANYEGLLARQFQNAEDAGAVPSNRFSEIVQVSEQRYLDLKASGPSIANSASGVARAVPRDNRVNAVGQEASIDSATRDALSDMALNPREPNVQELLDLLVGAATFDDTPGKVGVAQASDYRVVLNRLPYRPTRELADTYLDTFGERSDRAQRLSAMKAAFTDAAKHYRESAGIKSKTIDPAAFRAYIENTPGESAAQAYAAQLREFFQRLSALGLTAGEENRVRAGLLRQVLPAGQFTNIRDFQRMFIGELVSVK